MKYLIVGLGNIGKEYENTRHNIGFTILDALAGASNVVFTDGRYGFFTELKYKARTYILVKPTTYMNLSGRAVNYWLNKESVPIENLLIVTDDLALPLGTIRIKSKGSDGGHNGLRNITDVLGRNDYARLRFGIGDNFHKGQQVDYVLGTWSPEEKKALPLLIDHCKDAILNFGIIGLEHTMTRFNKKIDPGT